MRSFLIFSVFLLFASSTWAGTALPEGYYFDFRGSIDEQYPFAMTLYRAANNQIRGAYYYEKYEKRIELAGIIKDNGDVVLAETNAEGEKNGEFRGKVDQDGDNWTFKGKWRNTGGSKKLNFSAKGFKGVQFPMEYGHRYEASGTGLHDAQVENFAYDFKKAILIGEIDRIWDLSGGEFRVNGMVDGKPEAVLWIKSREDFENAYDDVFSPDVIQRLREAEPFMLFARDQGIMMGNGVIWLKSGAASIGLKAINH